VQRPRDFDYTAERLATVLGVSVAEIQSWAAGYADPSPSAFLRAIDIVADGWPLARRAAKS